VRKATLLGFSALGLPLLLVHPIYGHTVKHGKSSINYEALRGGVDGKTSCCDQNHCQPASTWWHDQKRHVWKFTVKWGTARVKSKTVDANIEVEVPENEVTYQDVEHKGIAHWCGEFVAGENQYYSNRCAFVPLTVSLGSPTLVASPSMSAAAFSLPTSATGSVTPAGQH
jgi:ketosteroid isomerase-like protein